MNERIRELALQANPASKEIYESDSWQFNCAAWSADEIEKFAELIVRECAGVDLYWLREQNRKSVTEKILKHFGVE